MPQLTITLRSLQNQIDGNYFGYTIKKNGVPLTYTSGEQTVSKTFKTSATVNVGRRNITALNNTYVSDFGATTGADNGIVYKVLPTTISGQQKYYIAGSFTSYNGDSTKRYVVRINADGTLDNTFTSPLGTDGGTAGPVRDAVLDENNKVYIVGDFYGNGTTNNYCGILLLNTSGSIDNRFNGGIRTIDGAYIYAYSVDYNVSGNVKSLAFSTSNPFGKFLNTTLSGNVNRALIYDTITLESSEEYSISATEVNGPVYTIKLLPMTGPIRRFALGGSFTLVEGVACRNYYNDNFRNPPQLEFNNTIYSIDYDTVNNKIYVGGSFTIINDATNRYLARLNSNNTVDTGFTPNINNYVLDVQKYNDVIYVGGAFTSVNGVPCRGICALDLDGTSTDDFYVFEYNNEVHTVAATSTRLLTGGAFTSFDGGTITESATILPIFDNPDYDETFDNVLSNLNIYNSHPDINYNLNSEADPSVIFVRYTFDEGDDIFVDGIADTPGYVKIILSDPSFGVSPIIVQTRSPFFISAPVISGSTSCQFDLRLFKGDYNSDVPVLPTYSITKNKILVDQQNYFIDVAPLCRDFLNTDIDKYVAQTSTQQPTDISIDESIWMQLTSTITGSTSATTTTQYLAIDGFGYPEQGVNPQPSEVLMTNDEVDVWRDGNNRIFFSINGLQSITIYYGSSNPLVLNMLTGSTSVSNQYIQSLRIFNTGQATNVKYSFDYGTRIVVKKFNFITECRYNVKELYFKNKHGFLQTMPFFKRSDSSVSIKNKTFNRSTIRTDASFNPRKHSVVTYLVDAEKEYTLNTGYIKQYMNDVYQELILSDEIYMNDNGVIIPVNISDTSWNTKLAINEKLISYTIKVKQAQSLIQNIR